MSRSSTKTRSSASSDAADASRMFIDGMLPAVCDADSRPVQALHSRGASQWLGLNDFRKLWWKLREFWTS